MPSCCPIPTTSSGVDSGQMVRISWPQPVSPGSPFTSKVTPVKQCKVSLQITMFTSLLILSNGIVADTVGCLSSSHFPFIPC